MQAKGPDGDLLEVEDVKTEILAILIATFDTTAAFICAFVNHMIDNPRMTTKLIAEIREFQLQGRIASPVVSLGETEDMPYFMACVNATLRVSPSTPVILPRVVSEGGLVLSNTFIPPGTEIGANLYVTNRDQIVFGANADDFNPERWIEDPERAREMHKWMFTWGWGPRDCVGKPFVRMLAQKLLLQVRSVISNLVNDTAHFVFVNRLFRHFQIEMLSDEEGRGRSNDRGLCIYSGQWLIFKEIYVVIT